MMPGFEIVAGVTGYNPINQCAAESAGFFYPIPERLPQPPQRDILVYAVMKTVPIMLDQLAWDNGKTFAGIAFF